MPSIETSSTSSSSATRLSSAAGLAGSGTVRSAGVVALAVGSFMPVLRILVRPALAWVRQHRRCRLPRYVVLRQTLKALSAKGQDVTSGLSHARLGRGMLLVRPTSQAGRKGGAGRGALRGYLPSLA